VRVKLAVSGAIGVIALLAWSGTAFAYGPTNLTQISTSSAIVDPCGATSVSGSGFQPGETVTLTLGGSNKVVGTVTADPNGSFTTNVTIPSGTSPGNYTITSTGSAGDTSSTTITVGSGGCGQPVLTSSTSGLAFTGADIALMVVVGGAAIGGGGVLVLASRRRRETVN
jgi:hypothetical protein